MSDENGNEIVDPAEEMANEGGTGTPPAAVDYQKLFEQQQLQMQQMAQQNAQLAQTVQQVAQRPAYAPQQVAQPDPFDKFDSNTAAALKAVTDSMNKQFEQKFAQQQQQFQSMQVEAEVNSITSLINDPVIAKRAQEVFRAERARGVPLNASNAVDFAIGEAVRNGTFRGNVPTQNQRVGSPPSVIPGGSRAPVSAKPRPVNFDAMSRKQQIAHLESDESIHSANIQGFWED